MQQILSNALPDEYLENLETLVQVSHEDEPERFIEHAAAQCALFISMELAPQFSNKPHPNLTDIKTHLRSYFSICT